MSALSGKHELLLVANDCKLSETGGGHAAKGQDFQRWWAVFRMIELKESKSDFLFLFEAIQDVTELDSPDAPTHATVYQVKKKDSGTWSWSVLTGIAAPSKARKPSSKKAAASTKSSQAETAATFAKVDGSALAKLYLAISAFKSLPVEGCFISNAGCDIPLAGGGNAATSMPCSLADFAPDHVKLLSDALSSLSPVGTPKPDLSKLKLSKIAIHPDDLSSPVIAKLVKFLVTRSPEHASQASAFAEALVMKVSPLTRKTDRCATFDELVKERGFSSVAFDNALVQLENVPDRSAIMQAWIKQIQDEGLDVITTTRLKLAAAGLAREHLVGVSGETQAIYSFCESWLESNPMTSKIRPSCDAVLPVLKASFRDFRDEELLVRFLMRAISHAWS